MVKDNANASENALRRLDLNPERAGRADRAPYAIVDIGSNSVRLVVYDQLGRAPLPRFNISGIASRDINQWPFRLMFIVRSQVSSDVVTASP